MAAVTKGAFAKMLGTVPSSISNWIKRGRLTRESGALVLVGGREMIDPEAARAELQMTLDTGQALGNGAETFQAITGGQANAAAAPAEISEYQAARTEKIRAEAEAARLKNEREAGRYVERSRVEAAFRSEVSGLIAEIDRTLMVDVAKELAGRLALDGAVVKAALREIWRKERSRMELDLRADEQIAAE